MNHQPMNRRRWLPWLLSLGFLASILSAFISPSQPEVTGDAADAASYRQKIDRLSSALASSRATEVTLSEAEINAHLAYILEHQIPSSEASGLTLALDDARVELSPERLTVFITGNLATVPVIFRVRFGDCGDYGPLPRKSIWVGHLPLIGPFGQILARRMKPLLVPLRTERTVVSHLETCKIEDDQLILSVATAD